jgi:hypothetical protein
MLAPPRWEATERFRFFGREAVETFFLAPLPCLTLGGNRLGRNRKDDRLRVVVFLTPTRRLAGQHIIFSGRLGREQSLELRRVCRRCPD